MKFFKNILLLLFVLIISKNVYAQNAQTPKNLFDTANQAYQNGQYSEAIINYESIVKMGIANFNVFYNLGNSYFRDKQIGKAVLNFERAFLLKPSDKDIRANLQFIRAMIKDEEGFLFNIDVLSLNQLFIIFCIFTWLFISSIILGLFKKLSFLFNLKIFFAICLTLNIIWLASKFYKEKKVDYAVIISETNAKNGPGSDYSAGFSLPEGKK